MDDDYRIESTKRLVERWAAAEIAFSAQVAPIREELATKEQTQSPSDEEKARIAELQRQRDEIRAKMEAESDNLKLELTLVEVQDRASRARNGVASRLGKRHHQGKGAADRAGDRHRARCRFRPEGAQADGGQRRDPLQLVRYDF